MKENRIFVSSCTSDKGLITRIYRELKKLNFPKINEPIKKWATELNITFSKEEIQKTSEKLLTISGRNANQYHNKIPPSSPFRITIIKNTTNNICWCECGEKGTIVHCWWKCKLVQPFCKKIWRLPKNLNKDLPYAPAIPLLGIYPKESNTGYSRVTCIFMFIASLFTIPKL
jgi:hypothetical protein